ncbi:hypothetical protein BD779DRAFT_455537 [Infundibulicybe gibba]|nr:hypothetical protein BD779DRAFT_1208824 [Infundibulicybe gibba]KAF8888652.1 hypothetical protein BD779DRAFT_455537 [Infundibulicybe gibba]
MRFLALLSFVAVFLVSCVRSAEIITEVRYMIMETWRCKGHAAKSGARTRFAKETFTGITTDYFRRVKPDSNVIVVHGRHQMIDIEGKPDRYDETINYLGKDIGFTVYLLPSNATLILQDEGGLENLRLAGNCAEDDGDSKVWKCK